MGDISAFQKLVVPDIHDGLDVQFESKHELFVANFSQTGMQCHTL